MPAVVANPAVVADAPDARSGVAVLSVGRLERYKRTETLVRALRYLPADYRVVVIGSGPAQGTLVDIAATLGLEDRLLMRGRCSDDELRAWYGHASVCVSLSEHESFGLVVMEAAASGCPVIASDIDAHRELLAFVPPGAIELVPIDATPEQLAASVVARATRGRLSSDRSDWRLPTWEGLVDQVLDGFDDVRSRSAR
jgi:glycosyltransferase involved in cell wall biosynthesis